MTHDPARCAAMLLADGYCIVENLLSPDAIAAFETELEPRFETTPFCEGGFYGARTKRFGALLRRSRNAAALVRHPLVLTIAETILGAWCDRIVLNLTQAVEIHPGALAQAPHRDQDLWGGDKAGIEYQLNVIWPIDPFTADNGATHIYPFSHGADGIAREDPGKPIVAECLPGAAICFLGSTAHGAGANVTSDVRRGLVIGYSLGWLKPYENPWLAYPPEVARHFSPELAALAGYAQHRPNLGNYEGQCPSILLGDEVPDHIGAIDALRPDQEAALADYRKSAEALP